MIKISVNGNRSDIAGYISYYSCKEIAPLLDIDEKEIIYETAIVDYFAFGDIDFSTKVETVVTISDDYIEHIGEINDILAKYLSGFVPEFDIRYEIINSNLIYSFKVAPSKEEKEECHCGHKHEGENCECCEECTCGDHCDCDENHKCNENCTCGDKCTCGDECTCGDDCKCGPDCKCHEKHHEA